MTTSAQEIKDRDGNWLVRLERRIETDAYRIEISRMAMEQLHDGDGFMIAMRGGRPELIMVERAR